MRNDLETPCLGDIFCKGQEWKEKPISYQNFNKRGKQSNRDVTVVKSQSYNFPKGGGRGLVNDAILPTLGSES